MEDASLSLGSFVVAADRPAFVIAEAGVNHNGDVALAHALIDAAAGAGAQAIKFQTFRAEQVVHASAQTVEYQAAAGEGADQLAMLRRLELPASAWAELLAHATESGLTFLSTAFDLESLELLVALGIDAVKVPSGELDNLRFLDAHAATGLPLIVSTGMATLDEVDQAVEILSTAAGGFCLLHCVTSYPAPLEAANLRAIATMGDRYAVPVGWSDHTEAIETAVAARALGACVFEKHLTIDRSMAGPDHLASLEPEDLAAYIAAIRRTETALGDGVKRPADIELDTRRLVRRSYFAAGDLAAGHTLREVDVMLLRPVDGVPASQRIVGRQLAVAVGAGQPIRHTDLT